MNYYKIVEGFAITRTRKRHEPYGEIEYVHLTKLQFIENNFPLLDFRWVTEPQNAFIFIDLNKTKDFMNKYMPTLADKKICDIIKIKRQITTGIEELNYYSKKNILQNRFELMDIN